MTDTTIRTNRKPRPYGNIFEFTLAQQKIIQGEWGGRIDFVEDAEFFFYKGYPHFLGDFMRSTHFGPEWDVYLTDTFFSAVLVKLLEDNMLVVGVAYC